MRRDMKIAFGYLSVFQSLCLSHSHLLLLFSFSLYQLLCCLCIFRVTMPYGLASYSAFSPRRLLSIYAFYREIGLNAYVKDPIKVAQSTPCDVYIYTQHICPGSRALLPYSCPQIRF